MSCKSLKIYTVIETVRYITTIQWRKLSELLKALVTSSLFYSFGKLFSAITPIQFFSEVSVPIRYQLTLRIQGHCFGKQN